ncbi:MAG: hypothetical protein M0R06_02570 [Sphaerochaeta sp.]|jgi:predicted  nucleic acid-binding Zn-ribbon protein|nr:hypothetical protein [Sphaerochaeta sp.]
MDLRERLKDVEERNRKFNEEIKLLAEKRTEIDKRISALRDEAIRQTGEFAALTALLEEEKKEAEKKQAGEIEKAEKVEPSGCVNQGV